MTRTAVQDHKHLYRVDGAFIVNDDDAAYRDAVARSVKRKQEIQDHQKTESRIDNLESKIELILAMLQDIHKG